jgi:hypothetical protein
LREHAWDRAALGRCFSPQSRHAVYPSGNIGRNDPIADREARDTFAHGDDAAGHAGCGGERKAQGVAHAVAGHFSTAVVERDSVDFNEDFAGLRCRTHAYPEVDLDLEFTDRRWTSSTKALTRSSEVDDAPDSRLTARRLGSFSMLLVGSPDYLARCGTPEKASDLTQHACIQFRYPNTGKLQVWPLDQGEIAADFQLSTSIVCNNFEARIFFALQGLGIGYLPDFAIRPHLAASRLMYVLPSCSESDTTFRIMWPSGKHFAPRLRVFIDFLCERSFPRNGLNTQGSGD